MRYVLDCSVALKWFLPEEASAQARTILASLRAGEAGFAAPEIIRIEFAHALRKYVVGHRMAKADALVAWQDFCRLPIELYADARLVTPALHLALDNMATVYDALYVALAEREGLQVLTADTAMTRAFARLGLTRLLAE